MTPCTPTTRPLTRAGYGNCRVKRFGKVISGDHVLAWVDHHGRLPGPGMQINHHCDNRPCVNVEHLYEGTHAQNMRDMVERGRAPKCKAAELNKAKTHCPQGHEYTPENTYRFRTSRQCVTCRGEREANRKRVRTKPYADPDWRRRPQVLWHLTPAAWALLRGLEVAA